MDGIATMAIVASLGLYWIKCIQYITYISWTLWNELEIGGTLLDTLSLVDIMLDSNQI